jgi:protein SMG8
LAIDRRGSLSGRVMYHRDAGKRMEFLHLTSLPPTQLEAVVGCCVDGELLEMLFMFSVSSDSYPPFAHYIIR